MGKGIIVRHSQFCKLLTIAAIAISSLGCKPLNAIKSSALIQIKKVTYEGVNHDQGRDFASLLQNAIGNAQSYKLPNNKYQSFKALFGSIDNPLYDKRKELVITYSFIGRPEQTVSALEGDSITLGSNPNDYEAAKADAALIREATALINKSKKASEALRREAENARNVSDGNLVKLHIRSSDLKKSGQKKNLL